MWKTLGLFDYAIFYRMWLQNVEQRCKSDIFGVSHSTLPLTVKSLYRVQLDVNGSFERLYDRRMPA